MTTDPNNLEGRADHDHRILSEHLARDRAAVDYMRALINDNDDAMQRIAEAHPDLARGLVRLLIFATTTTTGAIGLTRFIDSMDRALDRTESQIADIIDVETIADLDTDNRG